MAAGMRGKFLVPQGAKSKKENEAQESIGILYFAFGSQFPERKKAVRMIPNRLMNTQFSVKAIAIVANPAIFVKTCVQAKRRRRKEETQRGYTQRDCTQRDYTLRTEQRSGERTAKGSNDW